MAAFPEGGGVGVAFFVACHFDKGVVGYGAGKGYTGFDAPVVSVREERGVVVEEAGGVSVIVSVCTPSLRERERLQMCGVAYRV